MAEQKTNLKVHITGTVEGHEAVDVTHEGRGVLVFVDTGSSISASFIGEWSDMTLAAAINALKNAAGHKMFHKAMSVFLAHSMASSMLGGAEEEEENERKAAKAAGEVHNGEET